MRDDADLLAALDRKPHMIGWSMGRPLTGGECLVRRLGRIVGEARDS